MPKEKIVIEFTEKELKQVLCQRFDLQESTATLNVTKYEGNQREPAYVSFKITADRTKQSELNKMYYEK